MKPSPRYLLIVFAFAGDSTMTRLLPVFLAMVSRPLSVRACKSLTNLPVVRCKSRCPVGHSGHRWAGSVVGQSGTVKEAGRERLNKSYADHMPNVRSHAHARRRFKALLKQDLREFIRSS